MLREMRRKKQALPRKECDEILYQGTSGVLSLYGDDGYPYGVPLSYFYDGEKLYFHCAKTGHKLDAIARNGKASFCVIHQDVVKPEEYATYYKSVIIFGKIHEVEDEAEKREAIEKLAIRYAPMDSRENREREIEKDWNALCMLRMDIDYMSGKEALGLAKLRERKQAGQAE